MKYFNKWIFCISAFLSFSLCAEQDSDKIKINNLIDSYVANHAFDGGVILVAKSGEIIFERAYGIADRSKNSPVLKNSSFQIASLSKPITAALILKLEESGKLQLDSTLADYFSEFNNAFGKEVTLHHLLNHTSGLTNHFSIDGWFSPNFHKETSENEFVSLLAQQSPAFEPGEKYLYSNPGYFLLGMIIEKVTGKPYSDSLEKYIYKPLGMAQSGVAKGFERYPNIVKGYQWKTDGGYTEQTAKNMSLFGAGAGIYTSATDLYQFDLALYGNELLNNKSKKRLFDPQYPYSWRIGSIPVAPNIEVNVHTYDGKFDGYSAMMTRFIDDRHSVIILNNAGISYFLKEQLTLDIAAVLYDQNATNRDNDSTLVLINGVVSGSFNQTLSDLTSAKKNLPLNEQSLSSLAFELLWANMANDALHLFSFISKEFQNSSTAKLNLQQACEHRLSKNVENRESVCG